MRIIAGEAKGKKLARPPDDSIRPALDRIRESVFAILEGSFEKGRVLDLFAGVGSFGLEAVSRGARGAVFVDQGKRSLSILKQNIEHLGFSSRCELLAGDALEKPDALTIDSGCYALIFMDPPFELFASAGSTDTVFRRLTALLQSRALEPRGWLLLRHPSRWRGDLPLEPTLKKKYGESTVLFFRSIHSGW